MEKYMYHQRLEGKASETPVMENVRKGVTPPPLTSQPFNTDIS